MANVIKIKRGTTAPTSAILTEGELGFQKNANQLYIGTGTSVVQIGGRDDSWEFIVGTQAAGTSTGSWTGVTSDSALYEGKKIIYLLSAPGSGNATLNLTLAGGGTTGAKNVYYNSGTRMTTHFGQNQQIQLIYHENLQFPGSTTTYTGWWHFADYNANDLGYNLRKNYGPLKNYAPMSRYQILLAKSATHLLPVFPSNATNTSTNKTLTSEKFDPFGQIYYYNSTTAMSASNTVITATSLYTQTAVNLTYSFNQTVTNSNAVYLRATPQDDGTAILYGTPAANTSVLTTALPTSADGLLYIYLGQAYSTTNIELSPFHPIYYYKNGALRQWVNPEVTAASNTVGTVSKPVYLNNGAITALTSTVGSNNSKPVYMSSGTITAFTKTLVDLIYPVGSIYMSATLSTAAAVGSALGGTWAAWGSGRVPVGVNTRDNDFKTVEKTGGSKAMQKHSHSRGDMDITGTFGFENSSSDAGVDASPYGTGAFTSESYQGNGSGSNIAGTNWWTTKGWSFKASNSWTGNTSEEGTGTSGNLQPYITCYMYKRTA